MSTAYYGRAVPLALRRFARFSESNSTLSGFLLKLRLVQFTCEFQLQQAKLPCRLHSPSRLRATVTALNGQVGQVWHAENTFFSIFLVFVFILSLPRICYFQMAFRQAGLVFKALWPLFSFKQNSYASIWSRCARGDAHDKTEAHWACRFLARR